MLATHMDIHAIVNLARKFNEESENALPFDPVLFSCTVADCIMKEDRACFVERDGGRAYAFLLAVLSPYPAAPIMQANELLWYCDPAKRGKGAVRLFNEYLYWAESSGAGVIYCGAFEGMAAKLYERNGFRRIDENWAKVR